MARAVLTGLEKRFGDLAVLRSFSLVAEDGELVTVLGPSGCGKSTLLRLIAGLEEPTGGTITLDGRRIDELPPHERDVAMVFQSYALYPHMTVRANVEFPLRMRGVARDERRRRAEEVAGLLELGELLERKPGALSGGQRQRVALARALVRRPALFLLDEPLSNLDARLRESVRRYIRDVQRRLHVTTLYVTHDQTEAMTLGDRVVVLERGRVQQCDTPVAVYERPANAFVAGFVGTPPMNLLRGRRADGMLAIGDVRIPLDDAARRTLSGAGAEVVVGVRPEAFAACDGP
ncbi:MAG: ABC transporter ATP-binding protein, partial [Thermodesulfobacteriota bacterium]